LQIKQCRHCTAGFYFGLRYPRVEVGLLSSRGASRPHGNPCVHAMFSELPIRPEPHRSLHNECHRGCFLFRTRSASDGYRVGSRWRSACRFDWLTCSEAAPRLPQNATDEKNGKGIAQAHSASWGGQANESEGSREGKLLVQIRRSDDRGYGSPPTDRI
jgi:hypothetical protein